MILSALTGFAFAFIFAAIPVAPINLTILHEGARRGFKWALLIGLGATVMDTIYCAVSFTSFCAIFENRVVKASMQVATFVFLIFLGIRFLLAKGVKLPAKIEAASEKLEAKVEEKFHLHSAFMMGFVRVLCNFAVLLAWIVLTVTFITHDWVDDTLQSKAACVGGVFCGTFVWFVALSYGISLGHGKFSEKTLLRMQQVCGICLIVAGAFTGGKIALELARHTH